ncbi:hypothetical protein B2J93_5291 [Marssonina coronariae]|uniref:Uncharacterized protein n=1 Tax=Diplocarpon coronariae TaxID=2795749 RepID=A0A218ZEC4_9HELO|nr:hypothetical protein B2J93_5291 [Marssonina coronariae]
MLFSLRLLALAGAAVAIDLSGYTAGAGVQPEFKPFLEALVNAAEDGTVTTGYTDYFPADGMQTTLSLHCVGAEAIQKCKTQFLSDGRTLVVRLDESLDAPTPKHQTSLVNLTQLCFI